MHYYDPLGRFICMRNSMIERVGVAWYAEILRTHRKRLRQDILQDAFFQYFGHSLDILRIGIFFEVWAAPNSWFQLVLRGGNPLIHLHLAVST